MCRFISWLYFGPLIYLFMFILISHCLIALTRNSSLILNRNGRGRHFYLVPDLGGPHSVFLSLGMMLSISFLRLRNFLLFLACWEFLTRNRYWILSNAFFFCYYWDAHMAFFSFSLLIWLNRLVDLFAIKPIFHFLGTPHLVMMCYLFNLLDLIC